MSDLALYAHPFSSYCQKAFIAFYEKRVPFTMHVLSPENLQAGEALSALWPFGRFPVLQAGTETIAESSIIIEWLDQHYPAPHRLIPAEPEAALQVRLLDRVFDNYVMSPMQTIFGDRLRPESARDPNGVQQAHAMLDRAYAWLETTLAHHTWAAGADFTLADCAAAPALFYARWSHDFTAYPALSAYYARLLARPSFARCVEGGRPYRGFSPIPAPADCA